MFIYNEYSVCRSSPQRCLNEKAPRKVRSKSTGEHPHQSATPTNPPHKYTPSHKSTPKGLDPRILKSPN